MITEHIAKSSDTPRRFRAFRVEKKTQVEAGFVELDIDDLSPGEVVVKTAFAGLNYKDALAASPQGRVISRFPRVAGSDFSGTVISSSDARFAVGERVMAYAAGLGVERDGGFSEVVRVPAEHLLRVPDGLSLFDSAALGVAGFTAALAVHLLQEAGLRPEQAQGPGPVLVTGASGGVGSMAIDMLSMLGHEVAAMSGKAGHQDKLLALGASSCLDGSQAPAISRPLESARWAGAVDTVGGAYLPWVLATLRERGAVAALGNAAGNDFGCSTLPFILRSVRLIGVNATAYRSIEQEIWQRLATQLKPQRALHLAQQIRFEEIPQTLGLLLDREIIGRVVAKFE